MRPPLLPTTLLIALLTATPASGEHCEGYATSGTWADTGGTAAGRYYLDVDISQFDGLATWIYEESNDLGGLQREDEWTDDTCHGSIRGDTIIL